jgi:hypothetical protein
MRSRIRRRIVAFVIAAASALTIAGASAATASALVRGHAAAVMNFGRGGVFPETTAPAVTVIGGLAISAAVIALVTWVALRSDRRSRAQLALAASGRSGKSRQTGAPDHERKAA